MPCTRRAACAAMLIPSAAARAATLTVGTPDGFETFAEAVRRARDGDTIAIAAGTYPGDVAVITQHRLRVVGLGPRPVFAADGRSAEGKAIWVVRGGEVSVENIEFRGARVADGNGAGIRFERGVLTLVDCAFLDNEMGLLTANDGEATLEIRGCEFAEAPRHPGLLHHLLYIGRIGRATVTGSRLRQGFRGHLVKSRARITRLLDNHIVDGPLGQASYEIDLPNGGEAVVVRNRIGQSAETQNDAMVAFGAEGSAWPGSRLVLRDNVFVNDGPDTDDLVRVWRSRLPVDAVLELEGNRLVGPGRLR